MEPSSTMAFPKSISHVDSSEDKSSITLPSSVIKQHYLICHYCNDYMTFRKSDMNIHFKRKEKCKCATHLSYDEAKHLTSSKWYYFVDVDPHDIPKSMYGLMTTRMFSKHNYVTKALLKARFIPHTLPYVSDDFLLPSADQRSAKKVDSLQEDDHQPSQENNKSNTTSLVNPKFMASCSDPCKEESLDIRVVTKQPLSQTDLLTWFNPSYVDSMKWLSPTVSESGNISVVIPSQPLDESVDDSEDADNTFAYPELRYTNKHIMAVMAKLMPTMFTEYPLIEDSTPAPDEDLSKTNSPSSWFISKWKENYKIDDDSSLQESLLLSGSLRDPKKVDDFTRIRQSSDDKDWLSHTHLKVIEDLSLNPTKDESIEKKPKTVKRASAIDNLTKDFYNPEKNMYICNKCNSEYTNKYYMLKHLKSEDVCNSRVVINRLKQKNDEYALISITKESSEQQKMQGHIIQNIQNINNIQTINNNNNSNNLSVSVRDFIHENFDVSHIKKDFCAEEDFFDLSRFLDMIMQNESNHNVMFSDSKEAYIYTDNSVEKMSSEKAGFMVIDKVSKSVDIYLRRNVPEEKHEDYAHVVRYYDVTKNQYKVDTTMRVYDFKERCFKNTASNKMFRNRDRYQSNVHRVVDKYKYSFLNHMALKGINISDAMILNPSIEDFASTRMRYRELRDKY